jgi:hypothetical protein
MRHAFYLLLSLVTASTAFATPILTCKSSGAGGAMIKSLVLEKGQGPGYVVKMESAFEDGVVETKIPSGISTPVSTQYALKEDHDLKMTLVAYGQQAVVLYQSTDGSDSQVNVEFLKCK